MTAHFANQKKFANTFSWAKGEVHIFVTLGLSAHTLHKGQVQFPRFKRPNSAQSAYRAAVSDFLI